MTNMTTRDVAASIRSLRFLPSRLALGGLVWLAATAAGAATITVNSNSYVASPTPDGLCTLPEAMLNAEANAQPNADCAAGSGKDTIVFAGDYTIELRGRLPDVNDPAGLTIDGTGRSVVIQGSSVAGQMIDRVRTKIGLVGLTIRGFGINAFVAAGAQVDIDHCVFDGNGGFVSSVVPGGAFAVELNSVVNVESSTFSNNRTNATPGGAIDISASRVTIANSTFTGNSSTNFVIGGGAINLGDGADTTIVNSTFTANSAPAGSVFFNANSRLTLINSTVAGNNGTAPAIDMFSGTAGTSLTLTNTIVANNGGGDCRNSGGTVTATGVNLVKDGSCGVTNLQGVDPKLGLLLDNGGPTDTMALLDGSPAIDAANDGSCPPPATDQRGANRPQGSFCDIGAYEVVQSVLPPGNPMGSVIVDFDNAVLTGAIVGAGPGKSAPHRLKAFRNQLVMAGVYIDQSQTPQACSQLKASLKRVFVSGKLQAWHFVKGTTAGAAQALVDEINAVRSQLGCTAR